MQIKIKYFSEDYPRIEKLDKGDFIDLRIDNIKDYTPVGLGIVCDFKLNDSIDYKSGDIIKFGLGVAMELPKGYEAIVVPRSSTFTHWGLIQTNSMGVIDCSYCGDSDEWSIEFIATRNGSIDRFDRVCQFKIQENQPDFKFKEVDHLGNKNRGGYGTTGRR